MSVPSLLFPLPVNVGAGKIPLTSEVRVAPGLGDCLVSLTRSFTWVSPRQDGSVRSGYQVRDVHQVELAALGEIRRMSLMLSWGNVFGPNDLDGAIAHLRYFEINEVEVLSHDGSPWLPPGLVVVAPKDRTLLGASSTIGGRSAVIIHNAPRAVALCVSEAVEFPP